MSGRTRIILLALVASVFALTLCVLVGVGAYNLGRGSAMAGTSGSPAAIQSGQGMPVDHPELAPATEPSTKADGSIEPAGTGSAAQTAQQVEPTSSEPAEPTPKATTGDTTQTTPPARTIEPLELAPEDLDVFFEAWDIVEREFDGDLPSKKDVTYEAIAGSLELLDDRFTRFIPPDLAERSREQLEGSFEGIGAYVDLNDEGYLEIVRPIEGQPADLAGLESGDLVTHVDGVSVLGKSLEEIIADVKGPKGTQVTLTIQRESRAEPFDVTITRREIELPVVASEMLDSGIAYVWLTTFSSNADEQLGDALAELLDQDPQGLVLDLRDNPGGFLNQAVSVADLFLKEGVILYERNREGIQDVFESDDGDAAESIPLVVLVNGGSASASEIVAGAIQDQGRGILVGEKTFGKGSVQQTHSLSDGSELRVTIAKWYTPNDRSIDEEGITPDIPVETPEEFGTEADTQLQRAVDYLLNEE